MATLVLTAVGTAIGGPLGGALGSLIGSQIDGAVFGPSDREGPRLQELAVTTSSYGTPVPRHFGTMRAAGSIIWATDLVESADESGGGKGQPSVTTYSYSTSFAVALASRPIVSVRRIWADGNLLRGTAGDLKVGGSLRVYTGQGDQQPDPLIASDKGAQCPAFRGLSYCVFEDLQLADFGNRIPALTFEIIADDGTVSLQSLADVAGTDLQAARPLAGLKGFSDGGGPLRSSLDTLGGLYPIACDASGARLSLFDGDPSTEPVARLPEAAVDVSEESFGGASGRTSRIGADAARVPNGLRYYDVERDYQAGLQRAGGRARTGRNRIVEFPGALSADNARKLADDAAQRAGWSLETLAYRVAQLDPALGPGRIVTVPNKAGKWRIESWEWRENGLELELARVPYLRGMPSPTDAGTALAPKDEIASPTILMAFELPWDGQGSSDRRQIFAAASSTSSGWTGATLYAERGTGLVPIRGTGTRRSITGRLAHPLKAGNTLFLDRQASLTVQLDSPDFALPSVRPEDLAQGANRAVVGEEIIQFCRAEHLGAGLWRLSALLRGRGGSEGASLRETQAGAAFVLLDGKPIALDEAEVADSSSLAAIGLADEEPVSAPIIAAGRSRQPLVPVHAKVRTAHDGSLLVSWRRRSRGAWNWQGSVDVPLNEQTEAYEVGLGDTRAPVMRWETAVPSLTVPFATLSQIRSSHTGAPLWVRQIGTFAHSDPLFLTYID